MRKNREFSFWYDKILRLIAIRPRSGKEVSDYFLRKQVDRETSGLIMKKLEEGSLVDDAAFARWFVEQRKTFRPKGKHALRFELEQKGIQRELIDAVLEADLGDKDEVAAALKIVNKRLRFWQELPPKERQRKVYAILARRGFGWSVIERVLKHVDSENEHLT